MNMEQYIKRIYDNLKLEINLNYQCNLQCQGCNRLLDVKKFKSETNIKVELVERVIHESINNNIFFHHIALTGGEPSLHPHIFEICKLIRKYTSNFPECTSFISTNGYDSKLNQKLGRISYEYNIHINSSHKKNLPQDTQGFYSHFICPKNYGLPNNLHSLKCDKPHHYCGIFLNFRGFYICHMAGTIDMFLNTHRVCKSIKKVINNVDFFKEQIKEYCKYCSNTININVPKSYKDKTWKKILKEK